MKILIIGSGGREHAIVWKLSQSPKVTKIFAIPGNPGIAQLAECIELKVDDTEKIIKFVKDEKIDLTIVGPEIPLMNGIVDRFEEEKLLIFGPRKSAAMLEGSKLFAKNFMKRYFIPTAQFNSFTNNEIGNAINYVQSQKYPLVIKADGLAAGKGVVICESFEDCKNTIQDYFVNNIFGEAGKKIVIEEYMQGEEVSLFVLTDGEKYIILPAAQDHKKILDDDKGKNTGGMGAYSPARCLTKQNLDEIEKIIIQPTLLGMKNEGNIYKGCLYVGLMLTNNGPKVVEFNVRFGDPETQVVLPICEFDIADIFYQCANGNLNLNEKTNVDTSKNAVCVICASNGYPDECEVGKQITGLEQFKTQDNILIFHSGTKNVGNEIVTNGGRVLGITAIGDGKNIHQTINEVYSAVKKINFDGMYYRKDIAKKAIL